MAFLEEVLTIPFLEAINSFASDKLYKFPWELIYLDSRSTSVIKPGEFCSKFLEKTTFCTEKSLFLVPEGLELNPDRCYLLMY